MVTFTRTNINIFGMFLDLEFKDYVIPTKIEILETYNPGAVVRILALLPGNSNSNQGSDKKRLVIVEDN